MKSGEETKIITQSFICILKRLNKQTPPKRFACENEESLGSYSGQHAYKISDNVILTSTGNTQHLQD